jgi:hypothetical protein
MENLIGYVFGYKQAEVVKKDGKSLIDVQFITGTSSCFPEKLKYHADFWSEKIFDGQFSQIYNDPVEYHASFVKELSSLSPDDFSQEYQVNKRVFQLPLTLEQYTHFCLFSMTRLRHGLEKKWDSDESLLNALKMSIGDLFKDEHRDLVGLFKYFTLVKEEEFLQGYDVLNADHDTIS